MDLKTKAIKGTAWYTAVRLWTQSLSWAVTFLLARFYLSPEDYGLFGMAMAIIAVFELFQEFGLGSAIIQRQDISRQQVNAVFWIVMTISFALFLLTFWAGNLASWFYDEPRLTWLVRSLGIMFLLNAVGMVPYSLLSKEIDFRRRSLAEAAGVTLSVGVSIGLAYYGYGFWALVGGQLVKFVVKNFSLCLLCKWVPSLDVSFVGMKQILRFGLHVSGANGVRTLSSFINTLIIAKILGSSALGFYSMATSLGTNPFHKLITSVITQLSLPVFSKLQSEDVELRKFFLKISKYLALVALPSQIGMLLIGEDLVIVLLTEKWLPILELFEVFCITGIFSMLQLPSVPVLAARNQTKIVFNFQVYSSVALGIACLVGVQWELHGIAMAWLIVFPITRLISLNLALKELKLKPIDYIEDIWSPLLGTMVMAASILSLNHFWISEMEAMTRLVVDVITGALVYGCLLVVKDKPLLEEIKGIVQALLSGTPLQLKVRS